MHTITTTQTKKIEVKRRGREEGCSSLKFIGLATLNVFFPLS